MTDLKISEMTDGGTIAPLTDIVPVVRSGQNYHVNVGSAAAAEIGTGTGEVPTSDDFAAVAFSGSIVDIADAGALASLDTVGTSEIDNDAVTNAKLANMPARSIKANQDSIAGDAEDIELGNKEFLGARGLELIPFSFDESDFDVDSSGVVTIATTGVSDFTAFADGRLTLTSGVPVTTSDVASATTIYYTPYKGTKIALYTGSAWVVYTFSELSLALGTLTANRPYDVFLDYNGGSPTLAITAWTNGTTRATALTYQDGALVKSGDTEQRYLGTFYTISTTQTADSSTVGRYVWNYYNRVDRFMRAADTTNSWTYSTNSFRQANGSTANQLNFVIGVAEDAVRAQLLAFGETSGATGRTIYAAIGLDSTTTPTGEWSFGIVSTATFGRQFFAKYDELPGIGVHYLAWLERGGGADTQTWYGDSGGAMICGISGSIRG